MGRKEINYSIKCNKDLTKLSNSRVKIVDGGEADTYIFQSELKISSNRVSAFVERFIKNRLGSPKWVMGACSRPDGYLFG